jgi:hypothetical protein
MKQKLGVVGWCFKSTTTNREATVIYNFGRLRKNPAAAEDLKKAKKKQNFMD